MDGLMLQGNKDKATVSYAALENLANTGELPIFRTIRFRRALIAYRRFGMYPSKPVAWSLRDAVYYAKNTHHIHYSI